MTFTRTNIGAVLMLAIGGFTCQAAHAATVSRPAKAFESNYAVIGKSESEAAAIVKQNFPAVILENFSNLTANQSRRLVDRLSDKELAGLAKNYFAELEGAPPAVLDVFAKQLDAARLARVSKHFGYQPVAVAVRNAGTTALNAEYEAAVDHGSLAPEAGRVSPMAGPAPTIDMTIYEIYLEYRTAPVGSLSPAASIAESSVFIGKNLRNAFLVGTAVGTALNQVIIQNAPECETLIGGVLDSAINNLVAAQTRAQKGQYEKALDVLFGGPIDNASDFSGSWAGDWGITSEYDALEQGRLCIQSVGTASPNGLGDNCNPF